MHGLSGFSHIFTHFAFAQYCDVLQQRNSIVSVTSITFTTFETANASNTLKKSRA